MKLEKISLLDMKRCIDNGMTRFKGSEKIGWSVFILA